MSGVVAVGETDGIACAVVRVTSSANAIFDVIVPLDCEGVDAVVGGKAGGVERACVEYDAVFFRLSL